MESGKEVVRYKNDMLRLDITSLDSYGLKLFMAICSGLKDEGTNEVSFTFTELRALTGITDKYGKDFMEILDKISTTLMNVLYCEYAPSKKNGIFNSVKKSFFNIFETDADHETITVSVHQDMAYMLNDWKEGEWSQFALQVFNSIRGVAPKQLFRILVQDSNFNKAYISMEEAKNIMGCMGQRNNTFYGQTIPRAMEQFERLGIILPGWKREKIVRKNAPDTLIFTYVMDDAVERIKPKKGKPKVKSDAVFDGKISLLKQMGKSKEFIKCFEETGDYEKASILYKFRQESGEDVGFDDLNIKEDKSGSGLDDVMHNEGKEHICDIEHRVIELFGE